LLVSLPKNLDFTHQRRVIPQLRLVAQNRILVVSLGDEYFGVALHGNALHHLTSFPDNQADHFVRHIEVRDPIAILQGCERIFLLDSDVDLRGGTLFLVSDNLIYHLLRFSVFVVWGLNEDIPHPCLCHRLKSDLNFGSTFELKVSNSISTSPNN